ncbi:MAG: STAS domain-containing protein [bacterium]
MIGFSLEIEEKEKETTVNLKGEIDLYSCEQLDKTLTKLVKENKNKIILNMQDIQYIDSTGLGTIAKNAKELETKQEKLYLYSCQPRVQKMFEISGLNKKNITLISSENEIE